MTAAQQKLRLEALMADENAANPEYMRQVWERRAARLAQVPVEEDVGERIALILMQLGQETFGLEATYVFDIRPLPTVTPVPRTPDWVVGVVNLRGRIISVVDLQRFFRLPLLKKSARDKTTGSALVKAAVADNGEEATQYLVVVETPEMELALLTDGVLAVRSTPVSQIQMLTDAMMLNIRPDYVRGIIPHYESQAAAGRGRAAANALHAERNDGAMLVVLNLPTLLADKRLIIQEELT
ncbi:MAG TPA: chemotaxis protein CheW [Anaerolineae bacterium]|nr:chemotaxis protein CheW [Anaerolineae bacterium]